MTASSPRPVSPDGPLKLTTLGGASLVSAPAAPSRGSGGLDTPVLGPGKPLALLTYLCCSPRRTGSREHLVDLLWADLEPDKARHALRQTIWYLRQLLGSEGITAQGAELTLAAPIQLDRDNFLSAVGVGDLAAAAELYRGDFLAGFAAPGSVEFEHWADVERQRLRVAFLQVAQRLVRDWLDGGRFREATQLARRARDTARSSEAAWRLLLEALLASGEQLGFTLESSALSVMLAGDGREPEPATRALLRREEGKGPPAPVASRALVPALVGREQEFGAVIAAWERVTQQGGQHLHLTAPPGFGKTRLLADVHRRLRGLGARVVAVRANPGDRAIPYSLVGELARALAELPGAAGVSPSAAGTLVSLHPSLSSRFSVVADGSSGDEALRRRSTALGELLSVVSEDQPCAMLVDDLHWADPVSRQALRPLVERLATTRVLLVTAARPVPGLDAEGEATERVALHPLSTTHLAELLASLGQLPEESWSRALPALLREVTGGSPLLALETLQLALDRGLLDLAGGLWSCSSPEALQRQLRAGSALRNRIERLEPEPRRVVCLLAIAGTPLGLAQIARAMWRGEATVEPALGFLEQRGLAQRTGDLWQPAHDEIAALAIELASQSDLTDAHVGLGTMFADQPGARRADLARGASHLAIAGRWNDLRPIFVRYVRRARQEGDGRRLRHLVREFLPDSEAVTQDLVVRTMGRWNRVRYSPARTAALGFTALLLGMVALVGLRERPVPDAELLIARTGPNRESERQIVPIYRQPWQPGVPLTAHGATTKHVSLPLPHMYWPVESPDAKHAVIVREMGDSTTYDLYLSDPAGRATRVVDFPRDDIAPSWAPDGSAFVFVTSFWSPKGADNYDIAVYDLATRSIRRFTSGRGADNLPAYSPEGSRIGFFRGNDSDRAQLCWIASDGIGEVRCVSPADMDLLSWNGWLDEHNALVLVDSAGDPDLGRLNLESGRVTVLERQIDGASLSPDGGWIAVLMQRPGTSAPRWYVEPAEAPNRRRELALDGDDPAGIQIAWQRASRPEAHLERIEFLGLPDTISREASFQVRTVGYTATGQEREVAGPIRWASSDPAVFSVDGSGKLHPGRAGSATLSVSVGGWRGAARRLTIVDRRHDSLLQEDWGKGITRNFIPFGDPWPDTTTGPAGIRGLWNRGDGSYVSGAYSRAHWDASRGLGVEVMISAHLTRGQFQVATLQLLGGLDSLSLQGWDHRSMGMPIKTANYALRACEIGYPSGEGPLGRARISAYAASGGRRIVVDSALGDGHWFRLRLQIFQDGRCGAALDGHPIWISQKRLLTDRPFAVQLGYASYETKVLHGPLEIWQGVRDDVQWDLLDRR